VAARRILSIVKVGKPQMGKSTLMDSHDSKHFGHEENPRPDPDELTPRLGCGPLKTALNPTLRN